MPTDPDTPLPISAGWVAAFAAAVIGITLGFPVACLIFRSELRTVGEPFIALTTGLLSCLIVLRAAGRRTRAGVAWSAIGWSFVAGGINAGLALQYKAFLAPGETHMGPFVLGSLLGFFFAAPLSAGFALVNTALALGAREARAARSHQALDLMLGYAGAAVAAFATLRLAAVLDGWALIPIATGAVFAAVGFGRARTRRAWLRAIDRGEVPGLGIEMLDGEPDPTLPCLLGKADTATAVLVRARENEPHYRVGYRATNHVRDRDHHLALIDLWGP